MKQSEGEEKNGGGGIEILSTKPAEHILVSMVMNNRSLGKHLMVLNEGRNVK